MLCCVTPGESRAANSGLVWVRDAAVGSSAIGPASAGYERRYTAPTTSTSRRRAPTSATPSIKCARRTRAFCYPERLIPGVPVEYLKLPISTATWPVGTRPTAQPAASRLCAALSVRALKYSWHTRACLRCLVGLAAELGAGRPSARRAGKSRAACCATAASSCRCAHGIRRGPLRGAVHGPRSAAMRCDASALSAVRSSTSATSRFAKRQARRAHRWSRRCTT